MLLQVYTWLHALPLHFFFLKLWQKKMATEIRHVVPYLWASCTLWIWGVFEYDGLSFENLNLIVWIEARGCILQNLRVQELSKRLHLEILSVLKERERARMGRGEGWRSGFLIAHILLEWLPRNASSRDYKRISLQTC